MNLRTCPGACVALLCAALLASPLLQSIVSAADLSGNHTWKPVRLGAGGFVTGMVIHPLDPNVRYCRTDVGNAYRWDTAVNEWVPMLVRNGTAGIPASAASAPAWLGVESVAIDPQNLNVVLISFPARYTYSIRMAGSVFRSTDGGRNFVKSDLAVKMVPNVATGRNKGERMGIDPNDSQIAYYGTMENGLWKSANGGLNWTQLTTSGAPAATANVIGIRFDRVSPTATTVYAIVGTGSVLKSTDAGVTWANVSSGSALTTAAGNSVIDAQGNLYVPKPGTNTICKLTRAGVWSALTPTFGSSGNTANNLAVDPVNPLRIFAVGSGGCVSRSLDGGATWTSLGNFLQFANTLGWLPQVTNGTASAWRSNGGIQFDSTGRLWLPQGNEGVLNVVPSATNTETNIYPLQWRIDSKGIEEFVGRDVVLAPGGGDQPIVAMEDGTAFLIENPDTFVALQAHLADQHINAGTSLSVCPNDPDFIVVACADVYNVGSQQDYSGYSTDGGLTWTKFAARAGTPSVKAGIIAVSRRNGWAAGSDHLVWYPTGNRAPFWSHDGGQTWTLGAGLGVDYTVNTGAFTDGTSGFWDPSLKQHTLVADQFVPDKFTFHTTWGGPSRLYQSVDGGVNWTAISGHGLPSAQNATILSNPYVSGDYWFVDGQDDSSAKGIWHSTNGGTVYAKLTNVDRANNVAIGKAAGTAGAAPYSIYIYGRLTSTTDWGVFRSIDAGVTWDRLSYFPTGQFDMPTSMAASQDTFGLVYISYKGNSFVYGRPGAPITVPNAGFEAATNWSVWYDTSKSANPYSRVQDDNAPGGAWRGTLGGFTAYNTTVYQTVSGLTNGTYTLRGLVKSGGGHTAIRLIANNYDSSGASKWIAIPVSNSTYVQVTVPNIPVSNGKMVINVYAVTNTSGWVHFDQIELSKD